MAAVVTQQNQAKAIAATEQTATSDGAVTNAPGASTTTSNSPDTANTANNGAGATTTVQLNYPFTLLEVHEEIIDNLAKPLPSPDATPPI